MKRQRIQSSSVASVGYDLDSRTLELEYVGGDVYQYYDVPPLVHTALLATRSVGAFVNRRVKTSYRFEQIA
ncbi:KTSC domain-containing protein [Tenggerimyces flavus]|uniref:KTSC domain-containing protein n=1 Tax=Tenggerimyces flavus TaxID=1708749 RepID=A0ABV7YCU4_9ACTN|nr:KTSC domain-containing protein [Tenggerimyces flavus]MBM7786945.1 hypothetical protein [Tenggerimyces flavus]